MCTWITRRGGALGRGGVGGTHRDRGVPALARRCACRHRRGARPAQIAVLAHGHPDIFIANSSRCGGLHPQTAVGTFPSAAPRLPTAPPDPSSPRPTAAPPTLKPQPRRPPAGGSLTFPEVFTPFHRLKYSRTMTSSRQEVSCQRGGPRSSRPRLSCRCSTPRLQGEGGPGGRRLPPTTPGQWAGRRAALRLAQQRGPAAGPRPHPEGRDGGGRGVTLRQGPASPGPASAWGCPPRGCPPWDLPHLGSALLRAHLTWARFTWGLPSSIFLSFLPTSAPAVCPLPQPPARPCHLDPLLTNKSCHLGPVALWSGATGLKGGRRGP